MRDQPRRGEYRRETAANTAYAQPVLLAEERRKLRRDGRAAHQVAGRVTAYQADDGSLVCEDGQPDWDCETAQTPTGGSSKESWTMGASLIQQRRVEDDGLRVVNSFQGGGHGQYPQKQPRLTLCQQPR